MKRIALISDTHGYFGQELAEYLVDVDELWHAGDIGNMETHEKYGQLVPMFRAVYGNIDDHLVRRTCREVLDFKVEESRVLMMHIGGYPGHYSSNARQLISSGNYRLFVSGHSHIARVMYDQNYKVLHMNPGAFGKSGFHTVRTMLRFSIDNNRILDAELIEFAKR